MTQFSFTTSRLDLRKHLVLEEANAVETAFLRAGALKPPYRDDARRLLKLYVDDRAIPIETATKESVLATMERAQQLHHQLWSVALAAAEKTGQLVGLCLITVTAIRPHSATTESLYFASISSQIPS